MEFQSNIVVDNPSTLCSLGMRPHLLTGMLVQELRDHFSQPDRIDQTNLRNYLWRSELTTKTLMIDSLTRWKPQETSARPAILVRRNAWQVNRLGIGDRMQHPTALDGWDRFSVMMSGSHTLFCLAREGAECETLATEVFLQLLEFGPILRDRLELLRFFVVEIGQMAPVLEAQEHFGVPITIAYAHNLSWTVRKHTPVLSTIALEHLTP